VKDVISGTASILASSYFPNTRDEIGSGASSTIRIEFYCIPSTTKTIGNSPIQWRSNAPDIQSKQAIAGTRTDLPVIVFLRYTCKNSDIKLARSQIEHARISTIYAIKRIRVAVTPVTLLRAS